MKRDETKSNLSIKLAAMEKTFFKQEGVFTWYYFSSSSSSFSLSVRELLHLPHGLENMRFLSASI